MPLMADWLLHSLIQFGGTAALLAITGIAIGKWLWKKIDAALESYTNAYAQEAARIDARIGHLEKLAEEQARLTRTVESIKDEIAAEAKNRDNRWAFRKDVYCSLIRMTVGIMAVNTSLLAPATGSNEDRVKADALDAELLEKGKEFWILASLAPIATAESILPLAQHTQDQLFKVIDKTQDTESQIRARLAALTKFLGALQAAGRKDL